jgi:hypothetical protein
VRYQATLTAPGGLGSGQRSLVVGVASDRSLQRDVTPSSRRPARDDHADPRPVSLRARLAEVQVGVAQFPLTRSGGVFRVLGRLARVAPPQQVDIVEPGILRCPAAAPFREVRLKYLLHRGADVSGALASQRSSPPA